MAAEKDLSYLTFREHQCNVMIAKEYFIWTKGEKMELTKRAEALQQDLSLIKLLDIVIEICKKLEKLEPREIKSETVIKKKK